LRLYSLVHLLNFSSHYDQGFGLEGVLSPSSDTGAPHNLIGVCTRHVDTWYHFIRESIEEGSVKIKFVRLCDNESDI
jgi:hypothetical protein